MVLDYVLAKTRKYHLKFAEKHLCPSLIVFTQILLYTDLHSKKFQLVLHNCYSECKHLS